MFRKKSERFVFTKVGEKISADTVLPYLGKSIPVCQYGGGTIDVVKMPLDFNTQNILPSNMDYVSKSVVKKKDNDMIMASIEKQPFTINLYGPTYVIEKHIKLLDEVISLTDHELEIIKTNPIEAIYAMWDALMYKSVKGLFEIKMVSNNVTYTIESQLVIGKMLAKVEERKEIASPKLV